MPVTVTLATEYAYVIIVAIISLFETSYFGFVCANLRKKHNVPYPAITGHPEFDRAMRVHYNTVEGLGLYLTYLLISGLWLPWLSVVGGLTWIIGRAVYAFGYYQNPEKRIPGAYIFHLAELILLIGTIGFVVQLLRS